MPAVAEWSAVVIGNPSTNAPSAFGDSFHVAEALKENGLTDVSLRRELGADAMAAALDGLAGQSHVLLYFAGPIGPDASGGILMGQGGGDRRAALGPFLERLAQSGTREVILLIEDCAGGRGMAGRLKAPNIAGDLSVFMAASAGPEGTCSQGADRLTDRLVQQKDDASLQETLAGLWVGLDKAEPLQLAASTTSAPAQDNIIQDDIVVLAPSTAPVATAQAFSATEAVQVRDASLIDDSTVLFVPPPRSQVAAVPVAAGRPQPSIIVGIIEPTNASFSQVDDTPGDVSANEITYDNFEARQALKGQDPELFKTLVEDGAFDPPDVELARVIQTELQRMGCYTSSVDGIWGNGSRRSVDRFFAEIEGQDPTTRDPSVELFRQVILQDEIECTAPVAAAASTRQTTTTRTRQPRTNNTRTPRTSRPATTPRQPTPQPSRPSGGGGNIGGLGGGIFR